MFASNVNIKRENENGEIKNCINVIENGFWYRCCRVTLQDHLKIERERRRERERNKPKKNCL